MAVKEEKKEVNKVSLFKDYIGDIFGKKSGILVEDPDNIIVERFKSGSLLLDDDLKGGWAKGTLIEIYGKSVSGKTTLCIHAVAEHQKKYPDEPILWIDLEKVFDPIYFKQIGIDIKSDKFMLVRPSAGEDVWEIAINFVKTFQKGIVILDSIALLLPKKEDEGMVGDAQMALAARMNSQGLRKLFPYMGFEKSTVFVINQTRKNIGGYGDPTATTGGEAWEFYSRTRIATSKSVGEVGEYSKNKFKQIKSNYGYQDRITETTIEYGIGFNIEKELLQLAVEKGIIKKGGAWFTYGTDKYQGEDNFVSLLKDNPEMVEQLKNELYGLDLQK